MGFGDTRNNDVTTCQADDSTTTIQVEVEIESKCYNPAPSDVKIYFFFMEDGEDGDFTSLSAEEFAGLNFRISDDPDFERSTPTCTMAEHLPSGNYHRVEQHNAYGWSSASELAQYSGTESQYLTQSGSAQNLIEVPAAENIANDHNGYTGSSTSGFFNSGTPLDPSAPWRTTTTDGLQINGQPLGMVSQDVENWQQSWGFGPFTTNPQQQVTFGLTWELFDNLFGYFTNDYQSNWASDQFTSLPPYTVSSEQNNQVWDSNLGSWVNYPMDSSSSTTDSSSGFYQSPINEGLSLIMCDGPSGYASSLGLDGLFLHEDDCNAGHQVTCNAQDWWVNIQGAKYWDYGWQYYRPWAIPEGFYDGSDSGDFYDMTAWSNYLSRNTFSSSSITNYFGNTVTSTANFNFGQMFPTAFTVRDCPEDTSTVTKTWYVKMDVEDSSMAAKLDTMHGFLWFSMDEEKTGFAHPEVQNDLAYTTISTTGSGEPQAFRLFQDPAYVEYWTGGTQSYETCEFYHANGDVNTDDAVLTCDFEEEYACPEGSLRASSYPGSRGWASADGEDDYYTAEDYFCCCESERVVAGIRNWYQDWFYSWTTSWDSTYHTTRSSISASYLSWTWSSPFPLSNYQGAWDRLFGGVQGSVTSSFSIYDAADVPGVSWNSYDSYSQGVFGNQNVRLTVPDSGIRRNMGVSDETWFTDPVLTAEYKQWYLGTMSRSAIDFLYDNAFNYINYFFVESPEAAANYIPQSMNNLYATGTIGIYAGLATDYSLPILAVNIADAAFGSDADACDDISSDYEWISGFSIVISEVPVEVETDASEMASLVTDLEADIAAALDFDDASAIQVTDVSEYQYHDTIIDAVAYNTFESPMAQYGQSNLNRRGLVMTPSNRPSAVTGIGYEMSGSENYRTETRQASTYNLFWATAQSVYLSAGLGMSTRCDDAEAGYDGEGGRSDVVATCHDAYTAWFPWRVHATWSSGKEFYSTWSGGAWNYQGEKPTCSRGVTTCNQYQITFSVNVAGRSDLDDQYAVDDVLLAQLSDPDSTLRTSSRTQYVDVSAGLNGWDSCEDQPCLNGGTCVAVGEYSYECTCSYDDGFSGPNCGETWDSTPDQINSRYAYYTDIAGTNATIEWDEPGLGTWEWPIQGYRIRSNATNGLDVAQFDDQSSFCDREEDDNDCVCEEIDGDWWCELTGVYYDSSSDTCGTDDDETCHILFGLIPDTEYFFEIIAYNLDGDGLWSDPVYALHTHAVPDAPSTPVAVSNDDTTVTVELPYPITRGTTECGDEYDTDHSTHIMHDKDINGEYCTTAGTGSDASTYRLQYAECSDSSCAEDSLTWNDADEVPVDQVDETQEYQFEGLQPNTYYRFRFSATNAVGEGAFSSTLLVETYDVPDQPQAPNFVGVSDSTITVSCALPFNGGVLIGEDADGGNSIGVRLFGQSLVDGEWVEATRYTLTSNDGDYYYSSAPMDSVLPDGMDGWLEINTQDSNGDESMSLIDNGANVDTVEFEIQKLSHDTDYKFIVVFQNRVGDSVPSDESVTMRTLEAPVTSVQAYLGPPCIYSDDRASTFRAVSDGTNTNYKWETVDGSVIAEGGTDDDNNCENDSCSMMTYEFPNLGENEIRLIAYNTRGMRSVTTVPVVEYCGCTDIYDTNYWEHATYHLPLECSSADSWSGGDHDLVSGDEMVYQTYYDENVIDMDVTVRVDIGSVDVYWSTWQIPDIDLSITYGGRVRDVTSSTEITIPYESLYGSQTLYIKVVGGDGTVEVEDGTVMDISLSRFQVVAHQSTFTRGADPVNRALLEDQVDTVVTDLKTGYSDFYEYFFANADIDVDVEITTSVQSGCVSVFTSLEERFPDGRRSTGESSSFSPLGYWYTTDDTICDDESQSIMHTVKPWEGYSLDEDSVAYRGIFVSVMGGATYLLGDEQAVNEYTITAKIYRYRIDSVLMDFEDSDDIVVDEDTGARSIEEDYRYSVVTQDNFNYYELRLSDTGFAFSVDIDLVYGEIEVYLSNSKLPTLDDHDHPTDSDVSVGYDSTESIMQGMNSFTIDYEQYNQVGNYIYLGIFGTSSDSSYRITVTEEAFDLDSEVVDAYDGEPVSATISSTDTFVQIYVGEEDEAMEVTSRSSSGSRTSDYGADENTWGIDWTEPLTETWIEQNMDEYDLDVKVSAAWPSDLSDGTYYVFASTHEKYPSEERGNEVNATYRVSGDSVFEIQRYRDTDIESTEVELDSLPDTLISIPHFTFSTRMVYFNIRSDSDLGQDIEITMNIVENLPSETTPDAAAGIESAIECPMNDDNVTCNNHGSCVDGECLCDDQYLGDACTIEAFSGSDGQPQVTLTATTDDSTFAASVGGEFHMCYSGVPESSFVLIYLNGLPYPSKSSNVMFLYSDSECSVDGHSHNSDDCSVCGTTINVYGLTSIDVEHTLEVILLSQDSQALDTALHSFQIDNDDDFCKDDCSSNGVCHDGYCVCFDGYGGESCEHVDADEDGIVDGTDDQLVVETPGQGYVDFIALQNDQSQKMAQYENEMALLKNEYIIARSNEELEVAAAAVKETINTERIELQETMDKLAKDLEDDVHTLYLKREELEIAVQQMREESNRLQTKNEEDYIDFTRDMDEYMTDMQNRLDEDLKEHAQVMAEKADNWAAVKEELEFELNQLKTANGPLVQIDDLEETECTQDEFFQVSCQQINASDKFEEQDGYVSYGTGEWMNGEYVIDGEDIAGEYHDVPR